MIQTDCVRAEVLAGAVALGEASDVERDEYRRHLSGCQDCISGLGGERDIERTMRVVALARETENWEPDLRTAVRLGRGRRVRVAWGLGLSALAAAAVVAVGVHALSSGSVGQMGVTPKHPLLIGYDGRRIVLDRRTPAPGPAHRVRVASSAPAGHDLIVVHNVVTLKRPPIAPLVAAAPARRNAAVPAAAARATPSSTPRKRRSVAPAAVVAAITPSQQDKRSVAVLRTAQTAPPPDQRAESIAVMPATQVIRDVAPLGGENAIVPRPPPIAYYENAEGTTAFEVTVDEHGAPTKCTITKASGYVVLDEAVCRAAMRARYAPRTINGRAVSSLYHDAFTFRSNDNQ
jgi:TonB family protein